MSKIDEIIAVLKEDVQTPFPKYPSQALPALRNGAVVERLNRRFDAGGKLQVIRALEYDFQTGLNRLCFEFEASLGRGKDILVLLDGNCDLVGIVDPFDSDQPNLLVPPLSAIGGAMPFVIERPSASRNLPFDEKDLAPQDSRARAFMARAFGGGFGGLGGGGVFETDPCGPEAHQTNCTYCSFWMQTLKYMPAGGRNIYQADCEQMDTNADDCGTMA